MGAIGEEYVRVGHALVTGASGFIGRALVGELIAGGWVVTTAGRHASRGGAAVSHLDWSLGRPISADLAEIDVVFHCASATISAQSGIDAAVRLDVTGTGLLVEQCRRASRGRQGPAREKDPRRSFDDVYLHGNPAADPVRARTALA